MNVMLAQLQSADVLMEVTVSALGVGMLVGIVYLLATFYR